MSKKANLIGLLFSLAVIVYVLVALDWRIVFQTFAGLNLGWLGAAVGVYGLNYALRTKRFQVLLDLHALPFPRLFGVTNLYGMYLYLLPAKSGELSYPVLLKSRLNIPLPDGAASLIVARFYDFATIALFLPVVLLTFWDQIHPWVRWGALVFVALVFILGWAAIWFISNPVRIERLLKLDLPAGPGMQRLWRAFLRLVASLQLIVQRGQHWYLWLLTIAIWICVQTNFYFIVRSLGETLSFFQMVVISIIMVPMTLLPIQGFANLGTHEVGWVAAFALFGYTEAIALNIAVSSHILLLFLVLLLGAFGILLLRVRPGGAHV